MLLQEHKQKIDNTIQNRLKAYNSVAEGANTRNAQIGSFIHKNEQSYADAVSAKVERE
jgi:hypothetical protein